LTNILIQQQEKQIALLRAENKRLLGAVRKYVEAEMDLHEDIASLRYENVKLTNELRRLKNEVQD